MKFNMSKQGLEKLNNELKIELEKSNVTTALLYEPISDDYWSLDNRIKSYCSSNWRQGSSKSY